MEAGMEATSSPPPPPAPPPRIPWEDPARASVFERFTETVKLLATQPGEAYARMSTTGGIGKPLAFAIGIGWAAIIIASIWMLLFGGMALPFMDRSDFGAAGAAFGLSTGFLIMLMILAPIFVIIGVFLQAAILHLMLMLVGGAIRGFEATARVCSYAQAAELAQIVPCCGGILSAVWSLILLIVGLSTAHGITRGKAAVAVILPVVLCCGLMAALMFMGVLAGIASSR
jgi:hypothetical protein